VLSPIDGIVISRNVDVGQTVAASLQAPILFVIAEDLRKMQVDASVSEADVGRLRPGMGASFTVDAFPGRRFKGTVRQIRNASQTVQNVVTYTAVIDVANPELELRPGMTASVTFVQAERDDVLRVPNAALRFRPTAAVSAKLRGLPPPGPNAHDAPSPRGEDPTRRSVWVQRGQKAEPVPIRVGLSDGTSSELVEGALRAGDVLLTDAVDKNAPPAGSGRGPRFF
jgi:HlyD family secretion protein